MSTPMTTPKAPATNSQFNKRDDIQVVNQGLHIVICTGVIDLGTQRSIYAGKENINRKIIFNFEFPQHRQLFYESDTEPRPSMLSLEFVWMMGKNKKTAKRTKFLEFIEGLFGLLQESDYETFDVTRLLNCFFVATVENYYKKDQTIGARIKGVTTLNPQQWNVSGIERFNDLQVFSINHGFQSPNFAALPNWLRTQIKASDEGVNYLSTGGKFYKFDENKQLIVDDAVIANTQATTNPTQQYQNAVNNAPAQPAPSIAQPSQIPSAPVAPAAPVASNRIWMNNDFTYEQMTAAGWTDEALVNAGYMLMEAPKPVPPAMPAAPAGMPLPPAPNAPVANQMPPNPGLQFATQPVQNQAPNAPSIPQQPAPAVQVSPAAAQPMNIGGNQAPANNMPNPAAAMPFSPAPGFNTAQGGIGTSQEEHDDLPF